MDWSSHITYGKYLRASARAIQPLTYLFFVAMAVAFSLWVSRGTGWLIRVVAGVNFLVLMAAIMTAVMAIFLRRTFQASGSREMRYRLDEHTLSVMMGEDRIELPRAKLRVIRSGSDFVALRRVGRSLGSTLLFFDDPAVASRVADQLR